MNQISKELIEEQWQHIQKQVIEPLWHKTFHQMYEDVKLDYDDFESMCGWEITNAIEIFDVSKSSLITFATNVIKRKALTQIRDAKRNKRKASTYALSLDVPYGDSEVELKNTIVDDAKNSSTNNPESILNVCNYLNEISGLQKSILICKLLEFDKDEICAGLNITNKKFNDLMKNMKRFEKEQHLRRVYE